MKIQKFGPPNPKTHVHIRAMVIMPDGTTITSARMIPAELVKSGLYDWWLAETRSLMGELMEPV